MIGYDGEHLGDACALLEDLWRRMGPDGRRRWRANRPTSAPPDAEALILAMLRSYGAL